MPRASPRKRQARHERSEARFSVRPIRKAAEWKKPMRRRGSPRAKRRTGTSRKDAGFPAIIRSECRKTRESGRTGGRMKKPRPHRAPREPPQSGRTSQTPRKPKTSRLKESAEPRNTSCSKSKRPSRRRTPRCRRERIRPRWLRKRRRSRRRRSVPRRRLLNGSSGRGLRKAGGHFSTPRKGRPRFFRPSSSLPSKNRRGRGS